LGPGRRLALDLRPRRLGGSRRGRRLGRALARRRGLGGGRRLLAVLALAPLLVLSGEHPRRGLLRLTASLLLGAFARLLLGLTLGRGRFLGPAPLGVLGETTRVLLGARAGFLLRLLGVGQGADAGGLLLLGQRLEDHGTAARRAAGLGGGPRQRLTVRP